MLIFRRGFRAKQKLSRYKLECDKLCCHSLFSQSMVFYLSTTIFYARSPHLSPSGFINYNCIILPRNSHPLIIIRLAPHCPAHLIWFERDLPMEWSCCCQLDMALCKWALNRTKCIVNRKVGVWLLWHPHDRRTTKFCIQHYSSSLAQLILNHHHHVHPRSWLCCEWDDPRIK